MTPQFILSGIAILAGIFYFSFPYINKKYFQRPKLTLEIEPNKGITSGRNHIGYASDTDKSLPVNRPEVTSIYELFWKFDLIVRNNSEFDAYNIELYKSGVQNGKLIFKSKINPQKALAKHGEIIVPFEYITTMEIQHKNLNSLNMKEPKEFSDFNILLNYTNSKDRRFNTVLEFKTKILKFSRVTKKEINKNWR